MVPLCSRTIRAKSISNVSISFQFLFSLHIRRTVPPFATKIFTKNATPYQPTHYIKCVLPFGGTHILQITDIQTTAFYRIILSGTR